MSDKRFWLGEPPEWSDGGDTVTMRTGAQTDFWCRSMQDDMTADDWAARGLEPGEYVVDNGAFLYEVVTGGGGFTMSARVDGDYNTQYDQVGLMIRQDADNWLKASVEVVYGAWAGRYEYSNPSHLFGCTLTRDGWSHWAPLPESAANPTAVWLRVVREGNSFFVDYSEDGERYDLVSMFSHMAGDGDLMVGMYATSPIGQGFDARIDHYSLAASEGRTMDFS